MTNYPEKASASVCVAAIANPHTGGAKKAKQKKRLVPNGSNASGR